MSHTPSMTDDQISRLVGEGGNATLPEMEVPKGYLFKCLTTGEAKVFLSNDSLNKAILERASENNVLSRFESLIHKHFSELQAACTAIGIEVQPISIAP